MVSCYVLSHPGWHSHLSLSQQNQKIFGFLSFWWFWAGREYFPLPWCIFSKGCQLLQLSYLSIPCKLPERVLLAVPALWTSQLQPCFGFSRITLELPGAGIAWTRSHRGRRCGQTFPEPGHCPQRSLNGRRQIISITHEGKLPASPWVGRRFHFFYSPCPDPRGSPVAGTEVVIKTCHKLYPV